MTHRMTDYRDDPADLGDPGQQHPLDAITAATAIIGEIAGFIDPESAPVDAGDCASYQYQLRLAHRTLTAAYRALTPHRTALAALLDGHDPLREVAAFLDARSARMTAYLAQPLDSARAAEVRAKLAECEVIRRWMQALRP